MSKLQLHVTIIVTLITLLIVSPTLAQTATPNPVDFVATAQAQMGNLQSQLDANSLDTDALADISSQQTSAIDFDAIASGISIVKYIIQPDAGEGLFGPFWAIVAVLASSLALDIVWSGFYPGFRLFFFLFRGFVWLLLFIERMLGETGKIVLLIASAIGILVALFFFWGDVFIQYWQQLTGYIINAISPILLFLQPAFNTIIYLMSLTIRLIGQVGKWIVDTIIGLADMIWALWSFVNPFD